jgi:hypothetical protein
MLLYPVSYYRARFDLLVFPTIVITLYHLLFLFVVYRYRFIVDLPYPSFVPMLFQFGAIQLMFFVGYVGIRRSRKLSVVSLTICAALLIFTASLPVYFWGGTIKSIFTPQLLIVCTLVILLPRSPRLRLLFTAIALTNFAFLSFYYDPANVNQELVFYNRTGSQVLYLFYLLSIAVSLAIVVFVASRANTTVFADKDD